MNITLKRTVNLSEPILPEVLSAPLYEGEANAHTFVLSAVKDNAPHALAGSIVGYFERADGNTVRVEGETKDGCASITLSPECYQTGVFYLAVMLISDGAQTVIYAASGRVRNTQDGEIVNGGNAIPTYDEIMAHLNKYLNANLSAKVTQTESGATITLTDADGETTAVIKNGQKGEQGLQGIPGKDGESVSISQVIENEEDGGENSVIFSTGETLKVRNGKTGATGAQGPAGKDGAPGKDGAQGLQGRPGADGFSPAAKVTETADGATITLTDADGETTAVIKNGQKGEQGLQGIPGKDGESVSISQVIENEEDGGENSVIFSTGEALKVRNGKTGTTGAQGPAGKDGAPGKDGAQGLQGRPGADGFSPTVTVTQTESGATITATDKNGTTSATVKNGKDGADGEGSIETPTDLEIIEALVEADLLLAVTDKDGAILTDNNSILVM